MALTLARQLHSVILFDSGTYRNDFAEHQHMVLGFDHEKPTDYRAAARKSILSRYELTVTIHDVAVTAVEKKQEDLFELKDANGKVYHGKKLVLASGVEDIMPDMPGFKECWGKGIFHCLFCEGFEERGSDSAGLLAIERVANLGMALEGARHILPLAKVATIYTNGNETLSNEISTAITGTDRMVVDLRPIEKLTKGDKGAEVTIHFKDGSTKVESFLVGHLSTKARVTFAEKLGLEMTPSGDIKTTDNFFTTTVQGVFAVGDCGLIIKTVANAAAAGNTAAAACSSRILAASLGHKSLY